VSWLCRKRVFFDKAFRHHAATGPKLQLSPSMRRQASAPPYRKPRQAARLLLGPEAAHLISMSLKRD
jgi:hypothetical protein